MWILDASVLIALGRQHALHLLTALGEIAVPAQVRDEVTQEPEATNLTDFIAGEDAHVMATPETAVERARHILDDDGITGDAAVIAAVLATDDDGDERGVASDDRRIRTIAEGLGADVTGTIGVIVKAVHQGRLAPEAAKKLVRDIDRRGFHMTGDLRDTADRLINLAADETRGDGYGGTE